MTESVGEPRRQLGQSGLHVPPLILGTMARRGDDRRMRLAIYEEALASGVTAFDTAPLYGFGAADRLLGEAIRSVPRERLQILSKTGLSWCPDARGEVLFEFDDDDGRRHAVRRDSRPEAIVADVTQSLERLGVDYIDLVQIHHPDATTPIGETMSALLDLLSSGRVRAIGVSNVSAQQLDAAARALGSVPLASTQENFSLVDRKAEDGLLPYCRTHQIGFLAYSPLAGGLLGGSRTSRYRPLDRLNAQRLAPMAKRYGVEPATLAAAWAMSQCGVSGAIVGVSDRWQLAALRPAASVALREEDSARLGAAFAAIGPIPPPGKGIAWRIANRSRRAAGRWLRAAGVDTARWRRRLGGGMRR